MIDRFTRTALPGVTVVLLAGCAGPPPEVSFRADIQPLVEQYCTECHASGGDGLVASGFDTTSYAAIMRGTRFGPVVVPGDPLLSNFYRMVSGHVHPSIQMPHGRDPIPVAGVALIERWIEQGAKDN